MQERHFILYQNASTEYRDGHHEVLTSLRVEEVLPDGERKNVYMNIQLHNDSIPPIMDSVFESLVSKEPERRVRRSERGAA